MENSTAGARTCRQEIAAGSEGQRTRLLHRDELSMMGDDVGEALRMRLGGH